MFKRTLFLVAAVSAVFALTSCDNKIAYNSNSGDNGSRDSAMQLLVNTNKTEDISAPEGDNEDWYYFIPNEEGLATVSAYIDKPADIILTFTVMDGFGRPIHSVVTNHSENMYTLPEFNVQHDNYFISLITTDGKSSYTLRADFRLPDPEPDCEIGTFACAGNVLMQCKEKVGFVQITECANDTPECDSTVGECKAAAAVKKCVPADKCKKGENCCKPKPPKPDDSGKTDGIGANEKTVTGTIVLVTPRDSNVADVKINGLGSNKKVKKGAKAYLRGLNRKVDIYDCKTTYCMAAIKASSDELTHYDKVDVVVDE